MEDTGMLFIKENDCMKQAHIMDQVAMATRGKFVENGSRAVNARVRDDLSGLAIGLTVFVLGLFVGLLYVLAY
jgi:hypothetical protein